MKIIVINRSKHKLPEYPTDASEGMNLRANLENNLVLKPQDRVFVPTGLYLEIPIRYDAQIRPRSGLAIKMGITVLNSPGTIDADYRGEVSVNLINLSDEDFTIMDEERICQMVVARHEKAEWESVEALLETDRIMEGLEIQKKSRYENI